MPEKKSKRLNEGYQPIRKGYQPSQTPKNLKLPKGGTGLASKNSNKKKSNKQADGI